MSNKKKTRPAVKAPDTVVIAYIHPGQTSTYFTKGLLLLCMYHQMPGKARILNVLDEWSSANVSTSRNSLTTQFLDNTDAEWMLWIDADMAFDHNALELLLESAHPTERPIVGGLCFGMSAGRLFPTIYQWVRTEDEKLTTYRVSDYPDNTVVQCAATGAAFVLIHRTVLEKIRAREFNAAFPFFQETELDGQPAGEDLTFCIRAGILGIPVHVDTSVKIGHHKSIVLDHAMFQGQKEAAL